MHKKIHQYTAAELDQITRESAGSRLTHDEWLSVIQLCFWILVCLVVIVVMGFLNPYTVPAY